MAAGFAQRSTRGRRAAAALAAALGLAGMLRLDLWRCPVAELFGVPCPGCGLSRAAFALAAGDVAGALAFHPLALAVLPWCALLTASALTLGAPAHASGAAAHFSLGVALARAADWATRLLLALLVGVWISRFFGVFGGPVPVSSHLFG